MNRLLLLVLAGCVGLSACSKKEEVAAALAPPAASAAAAAPNTGRILQIQHAGAYTYAEVDSRDGRKLWIAGAPLAAKPGDAVQWGDYAVMQNFHSKTLGRTFEQILFVGSWGPVGGASAQVAPHGGTPGHPPMAGAPAAGGAGADQGVVKSVTAAGGYTYLEVEQGGAVVWVAAPETPLKAGDKVRWENGSVMRNFASRTLGRTFDQIVFASQVGVVR